MYACMCVCTYAHICAGVYVCMCAGEYVWMCLCMCAAHYVTSSYHTMSHHHTTLCHIIIPHYVTSSYHTMSHHHTRARTRLAEVTSLERSHAQGYYVTSAYILCHIILPGHEQDLLRLPALREVTHKATMSHQHTYYVTSSYQDTNMTC